MKTFVFILSSLILCITLGCEVYVLLFGYHSGMPDMLVGRILGLLDSVTIIVLGYWFGTTNSSTIKTDILARKE